MRKNIVIAVVLIIVSFTSCNQKQEIEKVNQFVGLWTLDRMEVLDKEADEWTEYSDSTNGFPNGLKGYILYDNSNHMAVHLVAKDYEKTNLIFPNALQKFDSIPSHMLQKLAKNIVYFSNYEVDKEKKIIEHSRISHINPNQWSEIVRRKYTFKGDTLILEPVEDLGARFRLKWVKEK
ncbi:lipocalin-like domain-containing protein [Psychroserpens sp. MEBiC05023]